MSVLSLQIAKKLCSAAEFELVKFSFHIDRSVSSKTINTAISLSRKLRDKYKDAARRQKLEIRGKRQARKARPITANSRTEKKALLFAETLARFSTYTKVAKKDPRAKSLAPKKDRNPKLSKLKKSRNGKSISKNKTIQSKASNQSSLSKRKSAVIRGSNKKAIQGHIRARTSRKQARRDSKNN